MYTTFKTAKKCRLASIAFREDGSVEHAISYFLGYAGSGDPRLQYVIDNVFNIIFADDIEEFKRMLKFIEHSNPNLFKKGWEMLEEKKSYLRKEVEKYTL